MSLSQQLKRDLWSRSDGNNPGLDGLRAVASILVVTYHCGLFVGLFTPAAIERGQLEWVRRVSNGGWSGIDIFFVLSGFLIGRILMKDLVELDRIRYRRFLARRSFRIFPAYYLILSIALFAIAPWNAGLFPSLFGTDWSLLLGRSWLSYAYLSNYFMADGQLILLSWGWSLCIEEQFYLLLPPTLWALFRLRSPMARLVALLGITLVPLCLRIAAYHRNPAIELFDGFYYRTHNRIDELLFGVVVAYLLVAYPDALRRFTERSGALLGLLALACFAAVWMVGGLQHGGAFSIIWQFWFAALGTSLLVLNVLFLKNGVTRFFAHHAWYPLARVSYGVFLIHPFVLFGLLSLMGKRMRDITMGDFALVTVSTHVIATLLAVLMFSLLERPLRDVGARVASRQR